jgi:hypothetical protein
MQHVQISTRLEKAALGKQASVPAHQEQHQEVMVKYNIHRIFVL